MNVQLVAKTIGVGKYKDLTSEEIVAAIARHGVIKEDNGKLIKYLMDNKHVSPLDLINFVFEVKTSLSIGRQLLRHQSIKPQEYSGRYGKSLGFEPIELRHEDPKNRQSSTDRFDPEIWVPHPAGSVRQRASEAIDELLSQIEAIYTSLLNEGVAKECARFILPNCSTTILTFNGTLRSWLTFLNVRCDGHAQKEARDIAYEIGLTLEEDMPGVFKIINWRDGLFM